MADVCVLRCVPGALGTIHRPDSQRLRILDRRRTISRLQSSRIMGGFNGVFGSATATLSPNFARFETFYRPITDDDVPSSPEDEGDESCRKGVNVALRTYEGDVPKSEFAPRLDPEVESLINRINANVVIMDRAVQNPLCLEVPKGYLMEGALSATTFYKTRTEVRTHAKKRKRELGALPKRLRHNAQHERHGFQAQEVNWTGAVHLEGCRPSNLTNGIHPQFDRSCFDDTPDAVYDQLIPALQLATMYLTQPICMQFWVTLAMGDRSDDAEMSAANGKPCQRIANHVKLTHEKAHVMIERLNTLGKSKLIHFRFKHRLSGSRGSAWGISDPICDYRGIQKEVHGHQGPLIRSIIRLHGDYYIAAKKLSQLKYPEISQSLRFHFYFASLLIHELAHSIEGIHIRGRADQWVDWHTSHFYKEPYWLDWQDTHHGSELGRAWEETMFGGELALINDRVDGSHGLGTSDWPPQGSLDDPERRIWSTVSMDYIEHMFQMETWQRDFDLRRWRTFNIPRDGAISLYINAFTTMSWDEEQRVANEEIAELVVLEHDQPAKKKRITGDGQTEEHRLEGEDVVEQAIEEQEQQPTTPEYNYDRQVPMFRNTRRLSSVMPGPLPDSKPRVVLSPRVRKPRKTLRSDSREDKAPHGLKERQRKFMEDQRSMDRERRLADEAKMQTEALERSKAEKLTSELVKKIRSKPRGLMDKHRLRKKIKLEDKRAEEKRKLELSEQRKSQIKEDLIAAWSKKRESQIKVKRPMDAGVTLRRVKSD